jgi:hypothetical protein
MNRNPDQWMDDIEDDIVSATGCDLDTARTVRALAQCDVAKAVEELPPPPGASTEDLRRVLINRDW